MPVFDWIPQKGGSEMRDYGILNSFVCLRALKNGLGRKKKSGVKKK